MTTAEVGFDRTPDEALAAANGVPLDEDVYTDYFGFKGTEKFMLPDGKQYFEYKRLNEGEKSFLESGSSREIVVQRKTGDAKMKIDPAADRHALIKVALVGWNLVKRSSSGKANERGQWVSIPFTSAELNNVLREFDPQFIEKLEAAIRKFNPSLGGDRSPEDIQAEIAQLTDELDEARKREAAKNGS